MDTVTHNKIAPTTTTSKAEPTAREDRAAKQAAAEEKWKFLSFLIRPEITEIEVFLLGMSMVMGTQNNTWNKSYEAGFGGIMFNILFVGSGYIVLCLCLAEMSSALPFSGGIYGFVRAASGPYYGYVVACFEVLFNIVYISALVHPLAILPHEIGAAPHTFTPVFIFIIYASVLIICLLGGKVFWTTNGILGATCVALMVIYLVGSLVDVGTHSVFTEYCKNIPMTGWATMTARQGIAHQFLGVQYLPLNSKFVKEPKKQIPRIILITILLLFFNAFFLTFAVCSQPPGIHKITDTHYPLADGFSAIFHSSLSNGKWLHIPGMFAGIFGFIYSYGRQLYSISKSGLLPPIFLEKIPVLRTPYVSLISGCIICFSINMWIYRKPSHVEVIKGISSLSSQLVFVNAFIGYILFRIKYSNIDKAFTSPLGIFGAVWGIINFTQGCIGIIFFHEGEYIPIVTVVVYLILVTLFYVFYMSKYQVFSDEEKQVMFKMYLINGKRIALSIQYDLSFYLSSLFPYFVANRENREKVQKHHKQLIQAQAAAKHAAKSHTGTGSGGGSHGTSSNQGQPQSTDLSALNDQLRSSDEPQSTDHAHVTVSTHAASSHHTAHHHHDSPTKDVELVSLHHLHHNSVVPLPVQSVHIAPRADADDEDVENHDSVAVAGSEEIRSTEEIPSESTKNVVALLSTTLKTISKSFLQAKDLEDYRALAVLQEGGAVDPEEENMLKEKFSLHVAVNDGKYKDIERNDPHVLQALMSDK